MFVSSLGAWKYFFATTDSVQGRHTPWNLVSIDRHLTHASMFRMETFWFFLNLFYAFRMLGTRGRNESRWQLEWHVDPTSTYLQTYTNETQQIMSMCWGPYIVWNVGSDPWQGASNHHQLSVMVDHYVDAIHWVSIYCISILIKICQIHQRAKTG